MAAAHPPVDCLRTLSSLELAQQLPKRRRNFCLPLGVNLSPLQHRIQAENQTKQTKFVTGGKKAVDCFIHFQVGILVVLNFETNLTSHSKTLSFETLQ